MGRIKRKQKGLLSQKQPGMGNLGSKWTTQGLAFSVALNIALMTSLIFNVVKSKKTTSKGSFKKTEMISHLPSTSSLEGVLVQQMDKNYLELLSSLSDTSHVEDGFSVRDTALSVLVHQYDLDLERALLGQEVKVRLLPIQKEGDSVYDYPLISGLEDSEYKLLNNFLQNERWPQTSFGLFKKLAQGSADETLKSAFYLSKEFMYIDALFCSLSVPKEILLDILLQGTWNSLDQFTQEHHGLQEFSNPLRIHFLSRYLDFASENAARLILEIDAEYALKKLSDTEIVSLIGLMSKKTQLSENFALHLAVGKRSDWVRREACRLIYYYSGQDLPEPYNYQESLSYITQKYQIAPIETFAPTISTAIEKDFMALSEPQKVYVVQEGDNLWKIAKKNKVHLDDLKAANHLDSDLIKVGMTLVIP